MAEIEAQANRLWKPANGVSAIAVSDFDQIVIPPNRSVATASEGGAYSGESMDIEADSLDELPVSIS